jgi:hypothetical protein
MTMIDLILILMYTCALVIKGCSWSQEAYANFGFGDSAKGASKMCLATSQSSTILRVLFIHTRRPCAGPFLFLSSSGCQCCCFSWFGRSSFWRTSPVGRRNCAACDTAAADLSSCLP